MEDQDLAVKLWAVGDEVRVRILRALPNQEDCQNQINVTALCEQLGLAQPTVSHHLRVLRQAGIIRKSKMCRDCYYWIDPEGNEALLEAIRELLISPILIDKD